jgi:hypothetical protein
MNLRTPASVGVLFFKAEVGSRDIEDVMFASQQLCRSGAVFCKRSSEHSTVEIPTKATSQGGEDPRWIGVRYIVKVVQEVYSEPLRRWLIREAGAFEGEGPAREREHAASLLVVDQRVDHAWLEWSRARVDSRLRCRQRGTNDLPGRLAQALLRREASGPGDRAPGSDTGRGQGGSAGLRRRGASRARAGRAPTRRSPWFGTRARAPVSARDAACANPPGRK